MIVTKQRRKSITACKLIKIPISTATKTQRSPTAPPDYTHYYESNGNRKQRRIAYKMNILKNNW